jgi:hypothetical protein
VTTTWTNVLTPEQKEEHRKELAKQVEEYLAKGGKITQCPPRAFTPTEGPKQRFSGSQFDSLTDPTNRDVGAMRPTKNKGGRIKVWQYKVYKKQHIS